MVPRHSGFDRSGVVSSHDLVAEFGVPPLLIRPPVKAGYASALSLIPAA